MQCMYISTEENLPTSMNPTYLQRLCICSAVHLLRPRISETEMAAGSISENKFQELAAEFEKISRIKNDLWELRRVGVSLECGDGG